MVRSVFRRPARPVVPPGLDLSRGERVLASDVTADGSPIAATNHRLILVTSDGLISLDWADIENATYDQDSEQLAVVETARTGSRPRRHRLQIDGAVVVLDVIREQVKASVVLSRYVRIADRSGVLVSGRRRPDTGAITWTVAVDAGLDVDDPAVRARVDAAIASVRAELP